MTAAIGLLGGTFDPVHFAHLRLAVEALDRLPVESIRWLPSGLPGHREAPAAGVEDRLAMLRLAIGDEPRYTLDETDARSSSPTFTVDTITRLRAQLGSDVPLVLIIGADQLLALDTWRDWRSLFDLTHFAVAQRPRFKVRVRSLGDELALAYAQRSSQASSLLDAPHGRIVTFNMTPLDISASAIRDSIAAGHTPRHLLPDSVLDYIASHGLYSTKEIGAR